MRRGPVPHRLTRRTLLIGAASGGFTGLIAAPRMLEARDDGATLASLASAKGLVLGAAFAEHELDKPYGPAYAQAYVRNVNSITSELAFKMSALRPNANALNFEPADRTVAFARKHALKLRAHTLIWNDDLPAWIWQLGPGEIEQLLDTHIMTMMERYRADVWAWDVVNEPIAPWDKLPGNLRKGPFLSGLGEGYIARAFRQARRHDPNTLLVLNEAQTETADDNGRVFRDSLLALLRRLKAEAVPIDAIGLQAHLRSDRRYDYGLFSGFLDEIAALGYAIHITELDVNDVALPAAIDKRDTAVAEYYSKFLTTVLAHKAVTAVTFWELADHTSWLYYEHLGKVAQSHRRPRPLLLDQSFEKKPAWSAVAKALTAMTPR